MPKSNPNCTDEWPYTLDKDCIDDVINAIRIIDLCTEQYCKSLPSKRVGETTVGNVRAGLSSLRMKLEKLFENARVDEIPLPTKIKFGYITNDREHIRFENDEIPQKKESIYVFGHIAGLPVSGVVANVFEDNRLEIWLSESRPVILGLAPWGKEND